MSSAMEPKFKNLIKTVLKYHLVQMRIMFKQVLTITKPHQYLANIGSIIEYIDTLQKYNIHEQINKSPTLKYPSHAGVPLSLYHPPFPKKLNISQIKHLRILLRNLFIQKKQIFVAHIARVKITLYNYTVR